MTEGGSGAGFPQKALAMSFVRGHAGAEHLNRHRAVQARVAGMVHLAHAAGSQETDDLIQTQPRSREEGHSRSLEIPRHSINSRCGVGRSLLWQAVTRMSINDTAVSGLGSTIKLRRRTT